MAKNKAGEVAVNIEKKVTAELIAQLNELGAQNITNKLKLGDDIDLKFNLDQKTALMEAAEQGQVEVIKLLVDAGANKDLTNSQQNTALKYAVMEGHVEAIKILLEAGANTEVVTTNNLTALMLAAHVGKLEVVKEFLKAGAKIQCRDKDGQSALMLAAKSGRLEVVKELLKAGADINDVDKYFCTALMLAAEAGRLEVVKELLKAGADIQKKNTDGDTALMLAAEAGRLEVVKELLKAGADICKNNTEGNTALIFAAKTGKLEVVKELLKVCIYNLNDWNHNKWTALMFANENGHREVVEYIEKAKVILKILSLLIPSRVFSAQNIDNAEVMKVIEGDEDLWKLLEVSLVSLGYGDGYGKNSDIFFKLCQKQMTLPEEIKNKIAGILQRNEDKFAVKFGELLNVVSRGKISPVPLIHLVLQKIQDRDNFDEQERDRAIEIIKYYKQLGATFTGDQDPEKFFSIVSDNQLDEGAAVEIRKHVTAESLKILAEHVGMMMVHSVKAQEIVNEIACEIILPIELKKKVQEADNKYQEMQNNPIARAILASSELKDEEIAKMQFESKEQAKHLEELKQEIRESKSLIEKLVERIGIDASNMPTTEEVEIVGAELGTEEAVAESSI